MFKVYKKLFSICLFFCMTASVSAEVISTISYNPSRMGEYTYLKISDRASFKGGLATPVLNINSSGTVSMESDTNLRIDDLIESSGASINMPNTVFHGNASVSYASYDAEDESLPSTGLLPQVQVKGGEQNYKQDSYINTLEAVNILKQKVALLKSSTTNILGNKGASVTLYEGDTTTGFLLDGKDIPEPTAMHTNTGKDLSSCELVWEKRKTSDTATKAVYLLALQDCSSSAPTTEDESED